MHVGAPSNTGELYMAGDYLAFVNPDFITPESMYEVAAGAKAESEIYPQQTN